MTDLDTIYWLPTMVDKDFFSPYHLSHFPFPYVPCISTSTIFVIPMASVFHYYSHANAGDQQAKLLSQPHLPSSIVFIYPMLKIVMCFPLLICPWTHPIFLKHFSISSSTYQQYAPNICICHFHSFPSAPPESSFVLLYGQNVLWSCTQLPIWKFLAFYFMCC